MNPEPETVLLELNIQRQTKANERHGVLCNANAFAAVEHLAAKSETAGRRLLACALLKNVCIQRAGQALRIRVLPKREATMNAKTIVLLCLLALTACLEVPAGTAITPTATVTATVTVTATAAAPTAAAVTCEVYTGIDGGTVNLRTCAGTSCAVLDIVTEGERLTVLAAGNWAHVTTKDGVTGYINSNYCKGK